MTTRIEAAAKAAFSETYAEYEWDDLDDELQEANLAESRAALAAADAHDAANGIHRVRLDPAAVERAAITLCSLDESVLLWVDLLEGKKNSYRVKARAVLAAAVGGL